MVDEYHGVRLFVRLNGKRFATPMFLVMIAIASTDLLLHSIQFPATFGVTSETSTGLCTTLSLFRTAAFTSFLRTLELIYLSLGLSLILMFIGVKLILTYLHESICGNSKDSNS